MARYTFTADIGPHQWRHEHQPWIVTVALRARFRLWAWTNRENVDITVRKEHP